MYTASDIKEVEFLFSKVHMKILNFLTKMEIKYSGFNYS